MGTDVLSQPFARRPKLVTTGRVKSVLLVIAVLLACNITLLIGRHTGRWDASDFFCPYFMLIADHARQGELLLWTPLIEGGCPAGFDPEIGALSPLTVGLAAVLGPSERAFCAYWLTIWGLAGLGVLILAWHYRAPNWLACVASIGYMFSAAFTNQTEYTAYLTVMSLLPWALWRLEVALDRQRLRPAAEAGAIWGLAALSGYPAMIIIGECYFGLWVLGRLWGRTSPVATSDALKATLTAGRMQKSLLIFAVFGVVSLVVLSPAYLGFLHELRGYSDRSGAVPRDEAVNADALDPKALSTFASPYLAVAGTQQDKRLWATDIAMSSIYLSPILFIMALAALWMRPRDRFRWWLAGVGLLCLAAAVGGTFPLRGWLYDALPPMRYFRHTAMFRCYYVFTVVVLAILAGRDLKEAVTRRTTRCWKQITVLSIGATVAAMATLIVVCQSAGLIVENLPTVLLAAVQVLGIWGGTAAVAFFTWKHTRTPRSSLGGHLVRLGILDAVLTVVLSQPTMFTDRQKIWPDLEAVQGFSLDLTPRGLDRLSSWAAGPRSPLNACLVGKVPVLQAFNVLRSELFTESMNEPLLAASALGADRIWFASKASLEPLDKTTLRRLVARSETLGGPCLVLSDPAETTHEPVPPDIELAADQSTSLERLPAAVQRPVQLGRYDGRCLEFDVVCPEDGWLLVTDRWAPSWQAWVNDRPRRVWIGNLVFRAVPVERGENRVCFQYRPWGYPWLAAGSWLTLALVCVGSMWVVGSRKRPGNIA
jgi:hypothetical protein